MRPDLFGFGSVEVSENSLFPVVIQDGFGVLREHFQAIANALRFVVFPLNQVLAGLVVLARYFWRVKQSVVNPSGSWMNPTICKVFVRLVLSFLSLHRLTLDSIDDGLERYVQVDHDVDG